MLDAMSFVLSTAAVALAVRTVRKVVRLEQELLDPCGPWQGVMRQVKALQRSQMGPRP